MSICESSEKKIDLWWKITPKGKPPVFFNMADVPPEAQHEVDPLRVGTEAIGRGIGATSTKNEFQGAERPPRIHKLKDLCIKVNGTKPFEIPLYYQGFV